MTDAAADFVRLRGEFPVPHYPVIGLASKFGALGPAAFLTWGE